MVRGERLTTDAGGSGDRCAYLAAAGLGYAMPTLRRRVAAIARAHRIALHPLDTKHPAIRETLRGIARTHGEPGRRSAALTTAEIKRLVGVCGNDLAGARDRALLLIGFAGALRRSELVSIDVEHVRSISTGIRLMIPRSKTDASGAGAEIGIMSGADEATCPVARCAPGSSWRKSLMGRCFVASPMPEPLVRGGCTRTRFARSCAGGLRPRVSTARSWSRSRRTACGPGS